VRRAWRVYLTVQVRYGGYQLPTISLTHFAAIQADYS
jgi:hypothetical protein